ncbi:MAG: hypothetical protein Kow0077_04610 [Anaerolineae bacterium]
MADFLNIFVTSPGNWLYFLLVIVISQVALLMSLEHQRRGTSERAAGRYALASLGLVLGWVVLSAGAVAGTVTGNPVDVYLPPLEHAVNLWGLLIVGWAFLTAETSSRTRRLTAILVTLLVLIAAGTIFTIAQWQPLAPLVDFNGTRFAMGWTFLGLSLSVLLLLLMIVRFRAIPNAPLKMLFPLLLAVGYGYAIARIADGTLRGDYTGAIRAAFLPAMLVFALVIYRYIMERLTLAGRTPTPRSEAAPPVQPPPPTPIPASEREPAQLLRALGDMLARTEPAAIPAQITVATANILKAEIVALCRIKDAHWLEVEAAYDNIQQHTLQGMAINLDDQPTIANAIDRASQRPLYPDRNVEELVDLYTRLDVSSLGPLGPGYIQPLTENGQVFAILLLLFPYTGRELREGETALLEGIGPMASKLLALSDKALTQPAEPLLAPPSGETPSEVDLAAAMQAREEMQKSLELAHSQIEQLSSVVAELKHELESEHSRIIEILATDEETLSISQQIKLLSEESTALEAERNELASRLQEARATLAGATATGKGELYQSLIEMLNREQAALEAQRLTLEKQLATLREQTNDMFLVPASIQQTLQTLNEDRQRLVEERDAIAAELNQVKNELELLGIEGGAAGLALVLGQLYEERDQLRAQLQQLSAGKSVAGEPPSITDRIQVHALQEEIARLAADREAIVKQRNALQQEKATWQQEREEWKAQRQRLGQQIALIQRQINDVNAQRAKIIAERNEIAEERNRLQAERDRLLAERTALQTERDQILARMEGDRELLEQLGADGLGALKAMIDDLTAERALLEQQLLQTQADLDLMESRLRAAEQASIQAETPVTATARIENPEVVLSIAQELRTPMSSIIGYTDLLLGESVGILGALQQKFLQRVKANIERMSTLIEDLVKVIALDSGQVELAPEPVDMVELLDDAITQASTQFKEKGITLNLHIDENIPPAHVDRDSMQQVLIQLLTNAYLVSPTDGEVSVAMQQATLPYITSKGEQVERPSVVVMVEDQGGGIPPEDQRRVFSRLYRAENPLIQGVGDTGVGLSIARALVEAHGGRIWVESEEGIGARFIFSVPLTPSSEEQE